MTILLEIILFSLDDAFQTTSQRKLLLTDDENGTGTTGIFVSRVSVFLKSGRG